MDNEFGTLKNLMADNGLTGGGVLPGTDGIVEWLKKLLCSGTDSCVNGCETACNNSAIFG